jgi:hypothetical protein
MGLGIGSPGCNAVCVDRLRTSLVDKKMSLLSHYPVLRGPLRYAPSPGPATNGLPALSDRLEGFRQVLCQPGRDFDTERGRQALGELTALLESDADNDTAAAYRRLLGRLADHMARETRQRSGSDLAVTAGGYAAVVAAMSRIHPEIDYSAPLGQLLELMARLFSARENGWKDIYTCLRSVPESVAAKQALNRVCLAEIREWFDAGVQNLFSLQAQLQGQIQAIRDKAAGIEQRLTEARLALNESHGRFGHGGKVTSLGSMVAKREIQTLEQALAEVAEEQAGREDTLGLIESDIDEFEQILRGARRAYRLQVV